MSSESGINILIVDDEQFILDSLTGFLEDFEFNVFRAESGEEALQILEKISVQAVIVDLRLPEMSGDTLIRKINSLYPGTKFVIHTGSVGYVLSEDLKAIGIKPEQLFFKPVPDLNILVDTVFSLTQEDREG